MENWKDSGSEQSHAALIRENRILKKKLQRCEINRALIEESLASHIQTLQVVNAEIQESRNILESESARFKALLETASDGIHIVDRSGDILLCSPSFAKMLGYDMEEAARLNVADWDVGLAPEEVTPAFDALIQAPGVFEARHKRKDGSVLNVAINARGIVLDGKGYLYASARDITEDKLAEELRIQVEHIVRHDLRSPASSAVQIAKTLALSDNLSQDERLLLTLFEQTGRNMLDTINTSLELYKIETGRQQMSLQTVDVLALLRGLLRETDHAPNFAGVGRRVLLNGEPPAVDAVALCTGQINLLRLALRNLLVNALEASPAGETVTLELTTPGCFLSIRNHGAAPPEIRNNFFDKFVTKGKKSGTGLGTYAAKMMIEAMGGEIGMRASDELDETVVSVRLPAPGDPEPSS